VKRQLLRLETAAFQTHVEPCFLRGRERQKLETGDGRCYLARDSRGAVTLFLALTCAAAAEDTPTVKAEYSRSLELEDGEIILRENGMRQINIQNPKVSGK
jgi:hypothetical protein